MTVEPGGRLRMTMLGGFLGSGKTTWLRHQLHAGGFADALVIVNEAADAPVDDALLSQTRRTEVLAGGCACCEGLAPLVALLRRLCDERSRAASTADRLDRIVLETSGLADPGPIVEAIRRDPVLVHHILIAEVVVAVDALHGLDQLRRESLGRRQAEVADRFVVTKVDGAAAEAVSRLVATLRTLNPGAAISGAVKGVPAALPAGQAAPEPLAPLDGQERRGPLVPTTVKLGGALDWTAFTVWLSALLHARGEDVVRVKGVVRTPAGRLLLQTVRRIVQAPEILAESPGSAEDTDDTIVLIGRGYDPEDLRRSLRSFSGLPP